MVANENRPDGHEEDLPGQQDLPQEQAALPDEEQAHPPVTLSYAEYEELKTLAAERDDYLRRLQHAVADYQNLQKRMAKLQESARDAMLRSLGQSIMDVADRLDLALQSARQTPGAEGLVEGLELVEQSFQAALGTLDMRPIEAVGRDFNPHYHEAVMQQPMADMPAGRVVRELRKGYMLGDRQVVRPTQVVVSAPPPESIEQ